MKTKYGFAESVTAEHLGHVNNEDSSRYYYGATAKQLEKTGINVNFAPDVDLNINSQCPAIGAHGRSYSARAARVNRHAEFFIEQHHKYGVKTSLKPFPGHGISVLDSHLGFTDITHTWKRKELKPYRYFIRNSLCDMVMVSHTFNSRIAPPIPRYPIASDNRFVVAREAGLQRRSDNLRHEHEGNNSELHPCPSP